MKPSEFGKAGEQWGTDPGWQVPVRFRELKDPLRPKAYREALLNVLPKKYSPIRSSGDGNQGVYLASVPAQMAARICELLGGQVEAAVERIRVSAGVNLEEASEEEWIEQRTDIGPREKLRLVNSRLGQGVYRENLEQIERGCRVTGVRDPIHLRASHIKPWCKCNDHEKLDSSNGLLLAPHVDHLFDRGYISFSDSGDLLVSQLLDPTVLTSWGLVLPRNVGAFRPEQCVYLQYHRREVFQHKVKNS
jgi:hypothetical protein